MARRSDVNNSFAEKCVKTALLENLFVLELSRFLVLSEGDLGYRSPCHFRQNATVAQCTTCQQPRQTSVRCISLDSCQNFSVSIISLDNLLFWPMDSARVLVERFPDFCSENSASCPSLVSPYRLSLVARKTLLSAVAACGLGPMP